MVRIDDNTGEDLDALAQGHYDALIDPINADGSYHSTQSLIGRIQAQRELDNQIPDPSRVQFWDYFLDNNFANLRSVVISRPSGLQNLINEIDLQFGVAFLSINNSYLSASLTEFGVIVKRVFNYENYRNTYLPASYFVSYNINYCTYCNKDEVQNIEKIDQASGFILRDRLYQLDHFYPRSRYPYLSLSFFNLIPGCANCNATLKGERDFKIDTHFNPFDKSFDDFFSFTCSTIIPNEIADISFTISNKQPFPTNTIEDFRILDRYNQGVAPELIFEMINLLKNRSKKVQRSILSQLKGLSGSVEHSNNELLKSQGVPLEAKDINKRHYGKLKRDVAIQLKLI